MLGEKMVDKDAVLQQLDEVEDTEAGVIYC